jgi:DNA-directed RNA polymerase subunit RPC12/RpoP
MAQNNPVQKHHWKESLPGDYLGAYALNGQDMVVTVQSAGPEIITGANGKKEECLVIHFRENILNMVCNRTNAKMISKVTGSSYVEDWVGKKITLYPTTTKFGGEVVECIRVRPTAPKQAAPIMCEKCGQQIMAAGNMTAEQVAEYGMKKYGKKLCIKCGKEVGEKQTEAATEKS